MVEGQKNISTFYVSWNLYHSFQYIQQILKMPAINFVLLGTETKMFGMFQGDENTVGVPVLLKASMVDPP